MSHKRRAAFINCPCRWQAVVREYDGAKLINKNARCNYGTEEKDARIGEQDKTMKHAKRRSSPNVTPFFIIANSPFSAIPEFRRNIRDPVTIIHHTDSYASSPIGHCHARHGEA